MSGPGSPSTVELIETDRKGNGHSTAISFKRDPQMKESKDVPRKRLVHEEPFAGRGADGWVPCAKYEHENCELIDEHTEEGAPGIDRTYNFSEIADFESRYLGHLHPCGGFALTFSGGGIRAASQGIGALRFFRDMKLLHSMQYLSGVSGGTYSGTGYMSHVVAQRHLSEALPSTVD